MTLGTSRKGRDSLGTAPGASLASFAVRLQFSVTSVASVVSSIQLPSNPGIPSSTKKIPQRSSAVVVAAQSAVVVSLFLWTRHR
jgi:hypothetical protein